jgi:putative ABC transport system ATP-binding protein
MIRVSGVTKKYGTGPSRVAALQNVSLDIPVGEFLAITGPSGCGKSTLLHLLGGLDRVTEGEIFLDDAPLHQLDDTALTLLRRDKVGLVFQFFNLLPTLTVEENVQLPGLLQHKSAAFCQSRSAELLHEVGLESRARHQLHQLSGGEMQRAALARALLLQPPLLLADEPTGNLDSEASAKVVALFQSLGEKYRTTVVLVTHSKEVAAAAHRQIAMRDGKILT